MIFLINYKAVEKNQGPQSQTNPGSLTLIVNLPLTSSIFLQNMYTKMIM